MPSSAETLCNLLVEHEKKIEKPHMARLNTDEISAWKGNAAMHNVDLLRVPIQGFIPMKHGHQNDGYMNSGIGFHGAKALESVYGILQKGHRCDAGLIFKIHWRAILTRRTWL